jgi:hypothetical protein
MSNSKETLGTKATTVGSLAKDGIKSGYKEWSKLGVGGKTKVSAIAGGLMALAGDHNGAADTVVDTAVGAGVGVGVGKATDYIVERHGEKIAAESAKIAGNVKEKAVSTGLIAKETVKAKTEVAIEKQEEVSKSKGRANKLMLAGAIGMTAFGAASLIDTNKKMQAEVRVREMKQKQEKNLVRQRNQEKEVMSQFQHGGPSDFGSIAFDMFNQRIGHHLMGNAKFE